MNGNICIVLNKKGFENCKNRWSNAWYDTLYSYSISELNEFKLTSSLN